MSKCPNPKCGKEVQNVVKESATVIRDDNTKWRGTIVACPDCKTIVGIVDNSFEKIKDSIFEQIMKKALKP
jgi:hypothetical protein